MEERREKTQKREERKEKREEKEAAIRVADDVETERLWTSLTEQIREAATARALAVFQSNPAGSSISTNPESLAEARRAVARRRNEREERRAGEQADEAEEIMDIDVGELKLESAEELQRMPVPALKARLEKLLKMDGITYYGLRSEEELAAAYARASS